MSLHRSDSELSRVNAHAAARPIAVSPELFNVLHHAQRIAHETDGAFSITLAPVVHLWGFTWHNHRLPSPPDLAEVRNRTRFRDLELDPDLRTVRFRHPGMALDLGGIGKGVAVDMAIARLRQLGVSNAMVRAGGDLRVIGSPPGQPFWTVQLEDPAKQGRRVTLPLRDAALSTAGNYENFFEVEGRRYSHILDPRTGWPVQGVTACTVIAPTCTESDAWSTACFVLGPDRSLAQFGGRFLLRFTMDQTPGAPPDRPIRQSSNFPNPGSGRK